MYQTQLSEAGVSEASPVEKEKQVHLISYLECYSRCTNQCIQFKPIRLGDPLQYPLPKIDGNPFTLLLEPRIEKDKVRCEAWKDEVQHLLIFVSLASASYSKADIIFV